MADIGGTELYRDSAGVLRETPIVAGSNGVGSNSAQSATQPKGYQQLSSDTLATATPLTVPSGATRAIVQNNGAQAARWRADGVAPTGGTGQRLVGGDMLPITGSVGVYQFIREAEGVQLDVTYYG